jgi:1-aminocyclopropane-1-carboxylate deaminase/D-cysteine desulfhydrase-like pyridoxal-dependent ACC family enzyme
MNQNELTPIKEYKDILLKRDDLFNVGGLTNGGKLRQALYLIEKNASVIEEKYYGNVVCSCSNKSPQSAIISEVCELYGFKSKIVTCKTDKPNLCLTIAKNNNSEIYGTKVGWNSVIEAKARQLFGFNIKMGFASDDIIEANIPQVQNLPRDLDYLVVPVGSGYNFISIMKGLERYQIPVGRVIGVWVGKNPTELIRKAIHANQNYILHQYSASYSTSLKKYGNDFDEIYEAKAYDWIMRNLPYKDKKVLLWVVGKRNYDIVPEKINFL